MTVTPFHTTQPCTTGIRSNSGPGYATGMYTAVCYIPALTGQTPREYPGPPVQGQFPGKFFETYLIFVSINNNKKFSHLRVILNTQGFKRL